MIAPIRDWSFDLEDDCIRLRPLDRPASAMICYVERVRCNDALPELLGQHFARGPLCHPVLHAVEEFVTAEGEFAALATLDCTLDDKPVYETFGCVWVDEFCSQTIGLAFDAQDRERVAATVRQLVLADTHMMTRRRRRYRHLAPSGWSVMNSGAALNRVYAAPDGQAKLTVAGAVPFVDAGDREVPATLQVHLDMGPTTLRYGETPCPDLRPGLRGRCFRLEVRFADGREGIRWVAELQDRAYAYPVHIDSSATASVESRAVLESVLTSISALAPLSTRQHGEQALALFAWMAD